MLVDVALEDRVEQIEVPDEEILSFARGVVGFEEFHRYVLFPLESPLYLLQSVEDPHIGFVLLDPLLLMPGYQVELSAEDRSLLGIGNEGKPVLFCIVTLSAEGHASSANLRAPVAINPSRKRGMQVILQEGRYPVRYPFELSGEGSLGHGEALCSTERRWMDATEGATGSGRPVC